MRLWHVDLIPKLPRQQLLGQHRECCALRGKGWGKRHSTVDYVFKYPISKLFCYHKKVMDEMQRRGYSVSEEWKLPQYRGKELCIDDSILDAWDGACYPEHNDKYFQECIENLKRKGIVV
jgi:uncharacterized protein (TIGR02328 family)